MLWGVRRLCCGVLDVYAVGCYMSVLWGVTRLCCGMLDIYVEGCSGVLDVCVVGC